MKKKGIFSRILAIIGPGLFLVAYNIGTGSITTMASAGSRWGLSLTWTIVLSCFFMFMCIWAFGKYTLITGDTILNAIKTKFPYGKKISLFILCSVVLAEFAGITGLTVIIVDLVKEWISQIVDVNNDLVKFIITLLLVTGLFVILWKGEYKLLEKALAIMVVLMGISFILTVFFIAPSWKSIFKGLVPRIPNEPNATLIMAGMVGTTVSSAVMFCRSITLKAKGWGIENKKNALKDAFISAGMMFLLSFAIMICAAGTLYVIGKPVKDPMDMVKILEPLAGKLATAMFILGCVSAGISSLIPTILIAPWLLSDFNDSTINPKSKTSRIFIIIGLLIAIVSPFIKAEPVFLMIITMALLSTILPLSTISITILLNQKFLGENRNSLIMNILCAGTVVFSVVMAYYGVVGLMGYFK